MTNRLRSCWAHAYHGEDLVLGCGSYLERELAATAGFPPTYLWDKSAIKGRSGIMNRGSHIGSMTAPRLHDRANGGSLAFKLFLVHCALSKFLYVSTAENGLARWLHGPPNTPRDRYRDAHLFI
jgi:hypothetical protein